MQLATVLLVTCELCLAIRVPVAWDESASEVKPFVISNGEQYAIGSFSPHVQYEDKLNEKPIPVEYFQYTAKKPQFAVDIAKFHGVQSPENHYKAYPIKPYTVEARPELGKHRLLEKGNRLHRTFQEFANINEDPVSHAVPVSSNYEVFHPYKAEMPALQEIYKDPIMNKIRIDLENSKNRLQSYEKKTGEPDNYNGEYLEPPEKTDGRLFSHGNTPAPYEIHRPQRRPVYYRPLHKKYPRDQYLNQKLRHPWNQHAKIRPVHYQPLKNHIHRLRQNHALKYDDERNEYPQVQIAENYSSNPKDGYDIYERGKNKFKQLRNNVDESMNKAVKENRPEKYQRLEMQNNDSEIENEDVDEEFVPVKNYAQVRKTETFKHLPRSAALEEAESFDEIRNAPRLREAVKSTKAQTIYSEEGYEDTAYDHAGEQKHASESEGHGGYLKENELSAGKYKTPTQSAKFEDSGGSTYREQEIDANKWKNDNDDNQKQTAEEEYSENEQEHSIQGDEFEDPEQQDTNYRKKRDNKNINEKNNDTVKMMISSDGSFVHNNDKHVNFTVPELDLNSTYLTVDEILRLPRIRVESKKDELRQKYPYYFKTLRAISKHSPLRYAENLKLIPKKSDGGTEFYDSRSKFECPEVEDVVDPIPDKLKKDGHPDDNDDSSKKADKNYETVQNNPRLTGLGDKIDCFKAKYFGENPLDSPFFKEDIILSPEPITVPNSALSTQLQSNKDHSKTKSIFEKKSKYQDEPPDIFDLVEKIRQQQFTFAKSKADLESLQNFEQSNVYGDIMHNIGKKYIHNDTNNDVNNLKSMNINTTDSPMKYNFTYRSYENNNNVTKLPLTLRRKRSTVFIYEPYKIIRDSQIVDSRKTTTTNNISPLIRQLQSSRFVDIVPKRHQDVEQSEKQSVKRNVNSRAYKDIGRKKRKPNGSKNEKDVLDPTIVDISIDSRRGEPRYEIRHTNHKSRYTPIENKKSTSVKDYKAQTSTEKYNASSENIAQVLPRKRTQKPKPSYSIGVDIQNVAASSNTVHNTISMTTLKPSQSLKINEEESKSSKTDSDEDYEEYEDDDDDDEKEIVTTTKITIKPSFRRRVKLITSTERIPVMTETPKLKLVTRFQNYNPNQNDGSTSSDLTPRKQDEFLNKYDTDKIDDLTPKYREKKKKSTKSTLVTDTKTYGDDDRDMQKEEVDALIGVKEDMSNYMPLYEKEEEKKLRIRPFKEDPEEVNEDDDSDDTDDDDDNDSNDDDDDDDSIDSEDDDDEEDNVDEDVDEEDEENSKPDPKVTTPEPTKQTLVITTIPPVPTISARNVNLENIPKVTRKKFEIHRELPVNKSAPHITHFKQDIKEVEIVKEIPIAPKRKPQKNLEALELYKDENLAKDVNKLGGVEVFKKDLDLKSGPRHGGNYRSLVEPSAPTFSIDRQKITKEDAEASQTEFKKHVELEGDVPRNQMHGGNLRSFSDFYQNRSKGRKSKDLKDRSEGRIDLKDPPARSMHGGNLQHGSRKNTGKLEKLIEFEEYEQNDDDSSTDHESFGNSRNSGPMHGGNYRREKLISTEKPKVTESPRNVAHNARKTSATILNSFVQAAPVLTTTPAYILDPSKRMYFYVDP